MIFHLNAHFIALMSIEMKNHQYLENGSRYQKTSESWPPKTWPFYSYIVYFQVCNMIISTHQKDQEDVSVANAINDEKSRISREPLEISKKFRK